MAELSATYYPKDGSIYMGAATDIANTIPQDYVGSLTVTRKANVEDGRPDAYTSEWTDITSGMADIKRNLLAVREAQTAFRRGQATAEHLRTAAVNDSAINQITIVQFTHKIIGMLKSVNVVSRAAVSIPANNLRGKVPEGSWPDITMQVDRLSEPSITHTDFGQTEYRIRRNDIHLYVSREDRMEAAIDPLTYSTAQAQKQAMQAHDLQALKALSSLTVDGTFGTFNDITANATGVAVPRSQNDSAGQFVDAITQHFTTWRNNLRYIIIHPLDYRAHQINFYTRSQHQGTVAPGWGVTPFVGLEAYGVTALISPWCPRTTAYMVADEGFYELDGPKIVDTQYDARKFADYVPIRDFIGYLLVDPERFGEKITLTQSGVTSGTEITTDAQIQTLLRSVAVSKNSDANSSIA